MEQQQVNINAGCSNTKRLELLAEQSRNIGQDAFESDDVVCAVPSEQLKNIASCAFSGARNSENVEIGEIMKHSYEPSEKLFVSSFETINDDCLREILQYLDIMDIVNLVSTSERLLKFSKGVIFPKAAKKICLDMHSERYRLTAPLSNNRVLELTANKIKTAFRYFGEFVEELTVDNMHKTHQNSHNNKTKFIAKTLAKCRNLKILTFYNCARLETRLLQSQIEKLKRLNELNFTHCFRARHQWSASNDISNVNKLTVGAKECDADHFTDYFKRLTSLSIDLNNWQWDDLIKMLDNNRQSLKHLKARNLTNRNCTPEAFARLITDSLVKLEYLELEIDLTDEATCLFDLPQLKSVHLSCIGIRSVNSFLGTLSNNGIIEQLQLFGDFYVKSVANAQPPLNFDKLRTISWNNRKRSSGIFKMLTESQMPEIQTADIFDIKTLNDLDDLCTFIESKDTLNTIKLYKSADMIPISFWRRIIGILQVSSTASRRFLSFYTSPFEFEDGVVSKSTFQYEICQIIIHFLCYFRWNC